MITEREPAFVWRSDPGLMLLGAGADFDLSPQLRLSANANHLWFEDTAVLQVLRNEGSIPKEIGFDLSAAAIWRPKANQNIVFRLSGAALVAGKGLVTSGSVGYELFDSQSVLGQTEFQQNLNEKRALEGELARTILSMRGITSARVMIALPRRELFQSDAAEPTASVVVGVTGGQLSGAQVQAIRNVVASAVPNLKPEKADTWTVGAVLSPRAVSIQLRKHQYGVMVAMVNESELMQSADFVLAVRARMPQEQLRKQLLSRNAGQVVAGEFELNLGGGDVRRATKGERDEGFLHEST